ncbi:MAG TPA: MBL fold metallo-hydrolase [Clostridiaceae bacterium]|nr:MBL fold metallo-hydrolase [Clostridiaceae bacterium]
MFRFCSLYSGSSGNSLFVESNSTRVLIDAGESCKKIEEGLANINVDVNKLDAILITHEHSDHVKGLGTLSKKHNIPVFANNGTWNSMIEQKNKISSENIKVFNTNENFQIGDLSITPFNIPHDATEPCGFNICHNNNKISIATDLGHITDDILYHLENSCFILLEANYDPEVLKCSPYPYALKRRIAGPTGHLSNEVAGKLISHLIKSGLKTAMLGHLSKENNFPELAYKTVLEKVLEEHYHEDTIRLNVASRYKQTPLINIV